MMTELHAQGRTISDIEECLKTAPLHPEMIRAVKFAAESGCDLHIVSDANTVFIQTILEAYKLSTYFKKVHTNPAHLDDFGVLRILPYHSSDMEPHGCLLCPPNMCKGSIVDKIRMEELASSEFCTIYIGDGSGDYCPSLRLTDEDHVFARTE
ncbi:hypothetical protein O6H91_07G064100 [Diphasiastrum complanatum]|nr:hypothetical protein O6H91_07G064100 [Diphasiastrum complanatum]